MTNIEAFRHAAAELVGASPDELSAFIESKYGIVIDPRYIPPYRATLQHRKNIAKTETSASA